MQKKPPSMEEEEGTCLVEVLGNSVWAGSLGQKVPQSSITTGPVLSMD